MRKLTDKIFYVENDKLFYDWKKIEKIPEFAVLKKCEQNPRWHSEGDAWKHTQLVCEAMENHLKSERITYKKHPYDVKLLMTAALFHDIGKGVTTQFKKGNWHAYGHEMEGEKIARRMLWDEGYEFREKVCSLIRWHMDPLRVFDSNKEILEKIARLSWNTDIKYLCALKICDITGSHQSSECSTSVEDIAKVKELQNIAQHIGCVSKPLPVPIDGKYEWKNVNDDRKPINVYMMVGLPGAGKDTLIQNIILGNQFGAFDYNLRLMPTVEEADKAVVLSRDDIRVELGFCTSNEKIVGTKYQEDKVTKVFNDRLKDAADNGLDIIIDAINIKKEYRTRIVEMLSNYRTVVNYVYVEAEGIDTNVGRRAGQIDRNTLLNMTERFEFPTREEYDNLYVFINNNENGWITKNSHE